MSNAPEIEKSDVAPTAEQPAADLQGSLNKMKIVAAVLGVCTIAFMGATIGLAVKTNNGSTTSTTTDTTTEMVFADVRPPAGDNPCEGADLALPKIACASAEIKEQSGTNVTKGYKGELNTTAVPITTAYWEAGLCPVNVHWHLGAEHLSVGEYDENGKGPLAPEGGEHRVLEAEDMGFQCQLYDESDAKFTTEYDWKHCKSMQVGQTYEVHWPHSALGACGTLNQYQTPFPDGVFCNSELLTETQSQIGVQGQVFVVVNDEAYYYPDLIRGMIVDGEMGVDVAKYTGSTTGPSVNNELCSGYSPITWQVDRKCHLISASTFDKMCADMMAQRDDMSDDLLPHGSRTLVADEYAANNHQGLRKKKRALFRGNN